MAKIEKKNLDIIRINTSIKKKLVFRFDELGLTNKDVCLDAKKLGYVIQESALSRYINNNQIVVGSLTQEQILWLCCRYCITLKLEIEKEIYNKKRAEELLNKYFGNG
jgi:hypothetical protein